jgi:hypothetical protein
MSDMMDFFSANTFAMWFVVLVFWATVILLSRARKREVPPVLLIIPTFFLLIGTIINRFHPYPPWGTYAVCVIHVMMLPALYRIARARP